MYGSCLHLQFEYLWITGFILNSGFSLVKENIISLLYRYKLIVYNKLYFADLNTSLPLLLLYIYLPWKWITKTVPFYECFFCFYTVLLRYISGSDS